MSFFFFFTAIFSLLSQSDVEMILLHCFPRLLLQRTREKENQISNTHGNVSVPSLFCSHSVPPFICSFSGWEVSLLSLPTYYSSRQNKQRNKQESTAPQQLFINKERTQKSKYLEAQPEQPWLPKVLGTCPHCSGVRLLCRATLCEQHWEGRKEGAILTYHGSGSAGV